MSDVARQLDAAVPRYAGTGDWTAVLRDAGVRTHVPRRRSARIAIAFAVVLVAAVAAVAWPFEGSSPSVIDRALAATGSGSVLHVVFDSPDGPKTLVDLKTGERTVVRGRDEIWFDPNGGLRQRSTFQGVVQSDSSFAAAQVPEHAREIYGSLGAGYRDALASGTAKVVGHGDVDGIPVYWIQIAPAHQVAVSHETYLPVEVRIVGQGDPTQATTRVLSYETLAADDAPLRAKPVGIGQPDFGTPGLVIDLGDAASVLGSPAVWAGDSVNGLGLTSAQVLDLAGTSDGLTLAYGTRSSMEYVELTETPKIVDAVTTLAGVRNYAPPEGTLLLAGSSGLLRSNGLVVAIHSGDPEKTIAIAQALRSYDG